jgi:XRE family transcriptional regulator, regulator of sulfur utilization
MLCVVQSKRTQKQTPQAIVGANVKRIRKDKAITQEELAEAADMLPSYLSAVENGMKNVTVVTIDRLARALDVPMAELLKAE